MDKIYQKYVILLKIKQLKAYKLKLESKWSLWFHELFNNDLSRSVVSNYMK